MDVSCIVDSTTGKIIEDSGSSGYDVRVGDAHLPYFMDPDYSLVYQSYMPDLYIYVDDRMTDNAGQPSSGVAPV